MTDDSRPYLPGDVILVHSRAWFMRLISLGLLSPTNHIAIFHHYDEAGRGWCLEARPGGVGWQAVESYGKTLDNRDQPKTDEQRRQLADMALGMIQTPYDWSAIVVAAWNALEREDLGWNRPWDGPKPPPAHLICSSYGAFLYATVNLAGPHSWRSTPRDWWNFVRKRAWESTK